MNFNLKEEEKKVISEGYYCIFSDVPDYKDLKEGFNLTTFGEKESPTKPTPYEIMSIMLENNSYDYVLVVKGKMYSDFSIEIFEQVSCFGGLESNV